MQCPNCQAENVEGHSYCTFCRAELTSGKSLVVGDVATTPLAKPRTSLWRALRLMLSGFLLFVVIIAVRSINWESVIRGLSATKTGIEPPAKTLSKPEAGRKSEPVKRKSDSQKTKPTTSLAPEADA